MDNGFVRFGYYAKVKVIWSHYIEMQENLYKTTGGIDRSLTAVEMDFKNLCL